MKKKVLSLLVFLTLVFASAFALSACNNKLDLLYEINSDNESYAVKGIGFENTERNIVIPDSYEGKPVTRICYHAFHGCDLKSVTIPDSVTSIGDEAFSDCYSLTSVTIGNGVTNIGEGAFKGCFSLTSIKVSENNSYYKSVDGDLYTKDGKTLIQYAIGKTATTFAIPDSVTSIGNYAFYNCYSLTSVTIPDSVTSIGDEAFYNSYSLTSVTIGNDVTSIGESAFYWCHSLTSIKVSENNSYYKSVDGDLYTKDGKTLIQYAIGKTATTFAIPDSVTSIGNYAFYNCYSLTSVTIPDSVTSIGDEAFYNSYSLTSVTIGNDVTSIGESAFFNCSSLTSMTIPDSVTSIGEGAFSDCGSLTSVTIGNGVTSIGDWAFSSCSSLKSVNIPDSVTSIGNLAFYECYSLKSVTIGNGVTSIGDWAFEYCRRLTSVTFNGTKAEWQAIEKGMCWKGAGPATVVVCTDGELNI